MSSMSSSESDVPVEPLHGYSGSRRADIGHESQDEQASVVDEDVVVIETRDVADDHDMDASEHRDADASEHRDATAGTIWSAGTSGPAEARPAQAVAEGPSAGGAPGEHAEQWSEIKAMFVDDPGESVKRASGLVERAIEDLMTSLRQRQESLASWEADDAAGTEELRNALRGYQSLAEQLDGMSGHFAAANSRGQSLIGRHPETATAGSGADR